MRDVGAEPGWKAVIRHLVRRLQFGDHHAGQVAAEFVDLVEIAQMADMMANPPGNRSRIADFGWNDSAGVGTICTCWRDGWSFLVDGVFATDVLHFVPSRSLRPLARLQVHFRLGQGTPGLIAESEFED